MLNYTFNEHRHNYAIWTVARAVQRNFTTTAIIKHAIDQSGLREFAESNEDITQEEFRLMHDLWAERLQTIFEKIVLITVLMVEQLRLYPST